MKVLTYNLNGIRAAMKKGLVEWIGQQDYDVICFQETKAQPEQVDLEPFSKLGYHYHYWHSAEKKGYSGTLTLSKVMADNVEIGMGIEEYDKEGRVLRTDFENYTILNCYFPSGTSGDIRQEVKYRFLDDFYEMISQLKQEREDIIVLGDYNVAHTEIDIHNPVANKKTSGFLPEERAWMTKWFESGFHDAFRLLYPEKVDDYSWWSYRAASRSRNKGWRIDYISVSDSLVKDVVAVEQRQDAVHSDHCPVVLELA